MRKNYNYARLTEGKLEFAPNILFADDVQIINATAEKYIEQGWLPFEKTQPPEAEEGFYYTPVYSEQDGKIVQSWEKHEYEVSE